MNIDYGIFERKFSIISERLDDTLLTVSAEQLLQQEEMHAMLSLYQRYIRGMDIQVAAVYFIANWRAVCIALQYMISLTESTVDLRLSNLTIQLALLNDKPRIYFVLNQTEEQPWPKVPQSEWREAVLAAFYRDTLRPIIETVATVSDLPATQLWGQFPRGIATNVNLIINELQSSDQQDCMRENHRFLVEDLSAEYFGLKRSPFDTKKIMIDNPRCPGEQLSLKPTCCFAYRIESGKGYCYTCPRLSKEEREVKRQVILASL
jgi:ferric iron reductase protein FhuF